MEPMTMGLLATGASSLLSNLFGGDESYPTLSDVDLSRDNPELYKELENLRALIGEYDRQYQSRRQGATPGEVAAKTESRGNYSEKLGNLGLLGSTAGANLLGAHEAQIDNALRERIFQERERLLGSLMNARTGYTNTLNSGMNSTLMGLQGRAANENQNAAARNQFFSGIFNAGMGQYGMDKFLEGRNQPDEYFFPEDYSGYGY